VFAIGRRQQQHGRPALLDDGAGHVSDD
jgi:hypothetical protein